MSRTASLALTLALVMPTGFALAAEEVYTVIREQGAAANAAFSEGDFATAATLYEAVEKLLQTVDGREKELAIVRFNLGRCYDEVGRSVEAIEAYGRSLAGPLDAQLADPIRQRVRELETEALGRILVRCDVDGAIVEVAGRDERATCGHTFVRVPPGPHVVLVRDPDGGEQRAPAEVIAGTTTEVRVTASDPDGEANVLAWSLTGGAALTLVGGLAFNIAARDAVDDGDRFDELSKDGTDQNFVDARDESYAQARTYVTASYVMFGVGAALAGGAAWAWYAGSDDDDSMAVMPWIGTDGLGIVGRF